jgi:hypothetical protein
MIMYDGKPLIGMHRVSNLGPGTPTHCCWRHGDVGM